ncbi:MAG TPA: substrate-binding domain-containing protein [Steroidobacteraceae bacterium]|nr:substrate-binding domain-containing protein [Steroidobacteraceae bacterium]
MPLKISLETVWRFTQERDKRSMLVMLDFLNEIRATGKITRAAERAGVSYRHAWNLIGKWSDFFGTALVERRQGRGTILTTFGERLVWAGQRLQARLGPQLQNLAQELESEINALLPEAGEVVRIHASHGFAVSALRDLLAREQNLRVDIRYVGNVNSPASLAHGGCDLAGMHLPQGELRSRSMAGWRDALSPVEHRVISFVTREMGLIVRKGNPLRIDSLHSLPRSEVRFVNRDPESGTRMLFDELLAQHDIEGARIQGYQQVEFTHAAVAAYVASGMADASFGVEAAARQFDLDFVPVVTEDYVFVCHMHSLENPSVQRILEVMRGAAFGQAIAALPGYSVIEPGRVKSIEEVFGRWT